MSYLDYFFSIEELQSYPTTPNLITAIYKDNSYRTLLGHDSKKQFGKPSLLTFFFFFFWQYKSLRFILKTFIENIKMREREDFILLFVGIELNTLFTFSKIYMFLSFLF